MSALAAALTDELTRPVPEPVGAFARALADPARDAAVLFYGSTLRTGDLTGLLDFYVLTRAPHRKALRGMVERVLWPEVSYHEMQVGGRTLRAKVATMPLATFRRAAEGRTPDTTIWARFVQPAAVAWSAGDAETTAVAEACAAAVRTASRFAAALGPAEGPPEAFWLALFRRTYAAEFRVESTDRAGEVLNAAPERYAALLPLAWAEAGVEFEAIGQGLQPEMPNDARRMIVADWGRRRLMGKPINVARLIKAAFTFEGAARYAAWKIERHTGVAIPVTPFREKHPILAAPGVLWRLRAARRRRTPV